MGGGCIKVFCFLLFFFLFLLLAFSSRSLTPRVLKPRKYLFLHVYMHTCTYIKGSYLFNNNGSHIIQALQHHAFLNNNMS